MGGGSSARRSMNHEMIEEIEAKRLEMVDSVENFIVLAYGKCSKIESMWLLLTSDLGQKNFQFFIKQESSEECLPFFKELKEIKDNARMKNDVEQYIKNVKEACTVKFLEYPAIQQLLSSHLQNEINILCKITDEQLKSYDDNTKDKLFTDVQLLVSNLMHELVKIMAQYQLDPFLLSNAYKNWRAMERSHASATTVDDVVDGNLHSEKSSGSMSTSKLQRRLSEISKPVDVTFSALNHLQKNSKFEILDYHCEWLLSLLAAVEVLPISFFLSKAITGSKGFPIIYVNKQYLKLTGYKSAAVLGKPNWSVLKGEKTQPDRLLKLAVCQKKKIFNIQNITWKRKNGEYFDSITGLKPVFTDKNKYCYVMGLMVEVEEEAKMLGLKTLVFDLLESLPNLIITDEEDPSGCVACF